MNPFRLSRRALLRGVGAGIALPLLDAMLDNRGILYGSASAQSATAPIRLFTFFFPGGCEKASWHPKELGAGYTLTDSLQPLAAHKAAITVVSGIKLGVNNGDGDAHARGTGCFATGAPLTKTASTGTSVDQVAQEELGQGKQSLVLNAQKKPNGSYGGVEKAGDIYGEISWSVAGGGVIEARRNPNDVFDSLFKNLLPSKAIDNHAQAYEQSVLSYVKDNTTRLQKKLGAADRQRLDAHLTAIRDLELRLMPSAQITCTAPSALTAPMGPESAEYSTEKAHQLMDLLALAMACDITRYGSFMLGIGSNNFGCAHKSIVGAELSEHSAAHDGSGAVRRYDQIRIYKRYQMTQLTYLLDKLAAMPEAGGSVLDHSAIFVGSELGDPASHDHNNMPVLVCGKAGGRIASAGSHIDVGDRPVGDLLLTLLGAVGSKATSIGNSTGVLPGILAGLPLAQGVTSMIFERRTR